MYYIYNKQNKNQYLGIYEGEMILDCITQVQPPKYEKKTIPCYNENTKSWDKILPDLRGTIYYMKTDSKATKQIYIVGQVIQDYYIDIQPPDKENNYQYINERWVLKSIPIKKQLLNMLLERKCSIAYTGVTIILNGEKYLFCTDTDSQAKCTTQLNYWKDHPQLKSYWWKVYQNDQPTSIEISSYEQLKQIRDYGWQMTNAAFKAEAELGKEVKAMTNEQLIDKNFMQNFYNKVEKQFGKIQREFELI